MIDEPYTGLHLRAWSSPWFDGVEILAKQVSDSKLAVATQIVFQEVDPFKGVVEPTLRLSRHQAQVLMDDLWACGIRPTDCRNGDQAAGALKATERHLADMQDLARWFRSQVDRDRKG